MKSMMRTWTMGALAAVVLAYSSGAAAVEAEVVDRITCGGPPLVCARSELLQRLEGLQERSGFDPNKRLEKNKKAVELVLGIGSEKLENPGEVILDIFSDGTFRGSVTAGFSTLTFITDAPFEAGLPVGRVSIAGPNGTFILYENQFGIPRSDVVMIGSGGGGPSEPPDLGGGGGGTSPLPPPIPRPTPSNPCDDGGCGFIVHDPLVSEQDPLVSNVGSEDFELTPELEQTAWTFADWWAAFLELDHDGDGTISDQELGEESEQ
jgi:hypothetical protein